MTADTEDTEDTEVTEVIEVITLAELHLADVVLDVLRTDEHDDELSGDALLRLLIFWRTDVHADPIPPMEIRPTAA